MKKNILIFFGIFLATTFYLSGCESENKSSQLKEIENLNYKYSMKLDYAENFKVDYYEGDYALLSLLDGSKFLVVPEDKKVPENLDGSITVIKQPVNNIYLVASATMSLFISIDSIDKVSLSGTNIEGWYLEEAKQAMIEGDIIYAGKYSQPDYELILSENSNLSIQSTMINHTPEVKEKLEELGITVFIDQSSSESNPLGRTEWMKLYSVFFDKEELAKEVFNKQKEKLEKISEIENTGKTVSFFYINSNGGVVVRTPRDYVSKMIDIAGGKYIFEDIGEESSERSTMTIGMEYFYSNARDADVMIYNGTIDKSIRTLQELLDKDALIADFSAVKNGNVWCTNENLYQASSELASVTEEINMIIESENPENLNLKFFYKLK